MATNKKKTAEKDLEQISGGAILGANGAIGPAGNGYRSVGTIQYVNGWATDEYESPQDSSKISSKNGQHFRNGKPVYWTGNGWAEQ